MKFVRLVLRNVSRNPRRTILTVFAIALAVLTYSTLASMPYVAAHLMSGPTSERRLISMNKSGFFYSLPAAYRQKIQALPHIDAVSSVIYFGGIYHSPSDQIGMAVDPDAVGGELVILPEDRATAQSCGAGENSENSPRPAT